MQLRGHTFRGRETHNLADTRETKEANQIRLEQTLHRDFGYNRALLL